MEALELEIQRALTTNTATRSSIAFLSPETFAIPRIVVLHLVLRVLAIDRHDRVAVQGVSARLGKTKEIMFLDLGRALNIFYSCEELSEQRLRDVFAKWQSALRSGTRPLATVVQSLQDGSAFNDNDVNLGSEITINGTIAEDFAIRCVRV